MQKQFLALLLASILAIGLVFAPIQFSIAQDEETKPVETAFETITEIATDEATVVVGDIIKDDPELTSSVEVTADVVAADPDIKPEVVEAIDNLETEVSASDVEAVDLIPELASNTTDAEVLMTLGTLDTEDVAPEIVTAVITTTVIEGDESFNEAVNVIICEVANAIMDGESVADATATIEADIAEAAEIEITIEEVSNAEATVTSEDVVTAVNNDEVDIDGAVENTVTTELGVETPDTEPEPTPDNGHGNKDEHATIIAQNEEIIELLRTQNDLLEQFLATQ